MTGAVGGDPGDLERQAVVEHPGDRTPDDGDADQDIMLGRTYAELVTARRPVMPVPLRDEAAGFGEGDWNGSQAHPPSSPSVFSGRCGASRIRASSWNAALMSMPT